MDREQIQRETNAVINRYQEVSDALSNTDVVNIALEIRTAELPGTSSYITIMFEDDFGNETTMTVPWQHIELGEGDR